MAQYLDMEGVQALWSKIKERDAVVCGMIKQNGIDIDALEEELAKLKATSDDSAGPDGSIQKMIADAIAKVVGNADKNYDTLEEIANWIMSDPEGAAKMKADIVKNAEAINEIKEALGTGGDDDDNSPDTSILDRVAALEEDNETNKGDIKTNQEGIAANKDKIDELFELLGMGGDEEDPGEDSGEDPGEDPDEEDKPQSIVERVTALEDEIALDDTVGDTLKERIIALIGEQVEAIPTDTITALEWSYIIPTDEEEDEEEEDAGGPQG